MSLVVVLVMEIGWWREGGRHVSVIFLFPHLRLPRGGAGCPPAPHGLSHRHVVLHGTSLPCPALPCPTSPNLTLTYRSSHFHLLALSLEPALQSPFVVT
jgi:hypothetical protein